jgi:predicted solute-binding protein
LFYSQNQFMEASTPETEIVDLEAVRKVLAATLAAHPPKEDGYRLSADSSTMAEIYATMIFEKLQVQVMFVNQMTPKQLETLRRWQAANGTT